MPINKIPTDAIVPPPAYTSLPSSKTVGETSPITLTKPQSDSFGSAGKLGQPPAPGQPAYNNAYEAITDVNGWAENALSSLQQPAYKIRFFMAEDDPLNVQAAPTYDAFVQGLYKRHNTTIAATGVTGLNIVSLHMTTLAGPNKATRSMRATTMTMVIKEPMGSSLMDILSESARELRVRNFSKAFYFIEISFQGYNEDGTFNYNPYKDDPSQLFKNKGVWLYQVGIQNIATEMDDTGGKYTITMIPYQETMYESDNLRLPESLMVTGDKVNVLLDDLATKLNESIVDAYGFQIKKYKFKYYNVLGVDNVPVGPADFSVIASNEKFSLKGSYSMSEADGKNGHIKAHFGRNMALNDIVEIVMANSEAATKIGLDVTTTEEFNGKEQADKGRMRECVIYRVEVTADIAQGDEGYDYSNEQYVMEYTLHVMPYYTQSPILAHRDVVTSESSKVQATNAVNLRKNGYLSKRYDYLFTGLNSEVLHLDIKFNLKWQAALPRILGSGTSQEAVAQGDKQNKDLVDRQLEQQQRLKAVNDAKRQHKEKLGAAADEEARLSSRTDKGSEAYKAQEKKAKDAREDAVKNAPTEAELKELEATKSDAIKKLNEARKLKQAQKIQERGGRNNKRDGHVFGEELLVKPKTTIGRIPISLEQSSADTRFLNSGAMPDDYKNDRSVYGAVLSQLYGVMSDGMQRISMDIKGDPFWMGSGNLEYTYQVSKLPEFTTIRIKEPDTYDIARPDYSRGDIMYLVSFKYPKGFDGASGAPLFKLNDFFTGVFTAKSVTHKFENGVFKQTLEGLRMPLIDVFKAFGYSDVANDEKDKLERQKVAEQDKKAQDENTRISKIIKPKT